MALSSKDRNTLTAAEKLAFLEGTREVRGEKALGYISSFAERYPKKTTAHFLFGLYIKYREGEICTQRLRCEVV